MSALETPRPGEHNRVPVTSGLSLRSGIPLVAGFIPAGILIPDRYEIPYHNPRTRKGYQRPPQQSRINELANDLRKRRVDLPTAILLNIRSRDASSALQQGALNLELLEQMGRRERKFYVVDGQHRMLALQQLVTEETNENEHWSNYPIPFVCMLGANEDQEMEQFHIVNSKAKSVRTDLSLILLRQRADKHPEVFEQLVERGKDWQVGGERLAERLADTSSIWRGRIRMPAMDKGSTTISSASMVGSLKPLLLSPYFSNLGIESQQKVLDAYWAGIRELLRPAFDEPDRFNIQKGVGVVVMHTLLLSLLEIAKAGGLSVAESESYMKILRDPLDNLDGDNADGTTVKGLDFWRVAPEGAAGSFSSNQARRVLIARLRRMLPEVEIL
jgi:DGQHR domain-containing protein